MKLLIIEDELPASNQLKKLVSAIDPAIEVVDVIDSVEDGIRWFEHRETPDLILTDIQLADGLSFEIFEKAPPRVPVIFTTAYDNYAIRAFKVNGIDYLLKPIDRNELAAAIEKARGYRNTRIPDLKALALMLQQGEQKQYKERFMVKTGDQLKFIKTEDIAYFFSEDGYTHLHTWSCEKRIIDYSLEQLTEMIDPRRFQRLNRQVVASVESIDQVSGYLNSRLKLRLKPMGIQCIVSRDRVNAFKAWMDR